MNKLPKIEDRIEIVQDKYSDEFGHSRLRTNAMDLPRRIPGFYYHSPDLNADDYEFVELDQPLGKIVKDRNVTNKDLHNNWDSSQKYLTKQSLEERIFYSLQERSYPQGYQFKTEFPKFEEKNDALMRSLQMLKVANNKLESYDREINRIEKLKQGKTQPAKKAKEEEYSHISGSQQSNVDADDEDLKPWKRTNSSSDSSVTSIGQSHFFPNLNGGNSISTTYSAAATKGIADYYYYNADMKRVNQRTKPGIDGTPVLESPYVLDPVRVKEAFDLRHYGAASVMNIRPDSLFEVSHDKEITEKHMENVVYLQSRKYGFMFDRRTKLRQKLRKGKRSNSPSKSPSRAAAAAAGFGDTATGGHSVTGSIQSPSKQLSPTDHASGGAGGGIRPLLNTRHVSLLFRDISSTSFLNGPTSDAIDFQDAINTAKQAAGITTSEISTEHSNLQEAKAMINGKEVDIASLTLDQAIHAAATALAATMAGDNRDADLPLSARRPKADDVFGEGLVQRLDTPTLRRSFSVTATPSRAVSRRLSRAASRANLSGTSPSRGDTSRSPSPVRQQSFLASTSPVVASPLGSFNAPFPTSPMIGYNESNHFLRVQKSQTGHVSSLADNNDHTTSMKTEHHPRVLFSSVEGAEETHSLASPSSSGIATAALKTPKSSFSSKRPTPLSDTAETHHQDDVSSTTVGQLNNLLHSPLKPVFSPDRRASFAPSFTKAVKAPPTIEEESSKAPATSVSADTDKDHKDGDNEQAVITADPGEEPVPGFEYLTMMTQQSSKLQRKPSIAFSFNPVSGKIEDVHFQSLQPKRRPHSADLDKSTQRNLLRRLQQKSKNAYEYLRQQRRAKLMHHGKDLSKICKINAIEAETERTALIDLYENCGGRYWYKQDNWCSNRPVREWYGVAVNVEGFVFELHLGNNNLTGSFPDHIMSFPKLEVINVDYNHLSGELPEYALQKCVNLTVLSARHNMLSGFVKFDLLVHLTSWREIWLSDNRFSGEIQDGITQLAALTHIDLDNNQLTGPIPRYINRLFNLQHLSLGRNKLTGHINPGIMSMDRLETLSLYSNRLTGKIPLWLKSMPSMQDLLLFDNCFDEN